MDDQRSLESQLLGDMTYDDPRKYAQPQTPGAPDPRLAGATVPVLDDMSGGYTPPAPQPAANPGAIDPRLAGAVIPQLDDMSGAAAPPPARPTFQYQQLTEEQIGILQQQRAAQGLPPYTPEEIAELQADFIERQRIAAQQAAMAQQAAAQQQAAAMLLSEPEDYTAKPKAPVHEALPQVDASALLEEPAPEPERKVYINTEDLEAAKKQAAKRASDSLNDIPEKTEEEQKRARKEIEALHAQQQADLAQAGFTVSIIVTIIGVIAGMCMAAFAGRAYSAEVGEPSGFFKLADSFYTWGGFALAGLSITIFLRVLPMKGFTSAMFAIAAILLVIPGAVILFEKDRENGMAVTAVLYLIALIGSIAVTFMMSTNDKLNAYYAQKKIMYD